jgi:site-specific DNA-methyltransferase (adenine-specific)
VGALPTIPPNSNAAKPLNRLYYGDNLDVLREHIPDESVDLIYLDPPFNSNANYNVLFKSPKGEQSEAQITAFEDTWHWTRESARTLEQLKFRHGELAELLDLMVRQFGHNDLSAYLVMMAVRLVELHRVLKPTGSLYLHCDPTASHYLKMMLDMIFGAKNFRNEIVWQRTTSKGLASKQLPVNHDVIFCYQKTEDATWNQDEVFTKYDLQSLDEKTRKKYNLKGEDGRLYQLTDLTNPNPNRPNLTYEFLGVRKVWRWTKERMQAAYDAGLVVQPRTGAVPRYKRYLDEQRGKPFSDVWVDIPPINSQAKERLGYPTQKPLALLERIIRVSSNPGDIVMDSFCGCGTAIHAAQKLGRQWIGIDITHLAIALIEKRLKDAFPGIQFTVEGTPKDLDGARDLANRDKYQFQWWACSLVNAQPYKGKTKGADSGIDGQIFFTDIEKGKPAIKKIIVSVKGGGNVGAAMVRDLVGTVQRTKAEIGLFITLTLPTKPMEKEAAAAGFYRAGNGREYPRIQILTIEDLLTRRKRPEYWDMSLGELTFKKAQKESRDVAVQGHLF